MARAEHPGVDVWELITRAEAASPVEAVDVMADELAAMLGALDVCFLITDLGGRAVARFGGSASNAARERQQGAEHAPTVQLAGTVYERVLRSQLPDMSDVVHGTRVVVPVTDRGNAVGVIELNLPWRPDAREVAEIVAAGRALASVVVVCRQHTDLFEWAQRATPFSLAAEIQRRLLPGAFTCETRQFTIAGWLEPANAVGGDTFDYALDRDTVHASITDAVGHDVNAAMLATIVVGSLRNSRRRNLTLLDQARLANEALARHSPVGEFVTGQLVRVALRTGIMSVINAGHPHPYQVRDGRVAAIELAVDMPFGIKPGRAFTLQQVPLQPGDRIVLVTDGILERGAASVDIPGLLAATAQQHPREIVYIVGEAVLRANGGNLRDDATVMCLDWRGGPHQVPDRAGVARQQGSATP